MSTILSTPVPVQNPFSVLSESDHTNDFASPPISSYRSLYSSTTPRASHTRTTSTDSVISSWSVVHSNVDTDNEDQDDDVLFPELGNEQLHAPLAISILSDGFTGISKAPTATSVNSSTAASQTDVWVIKVDKKKTKRLQRPPKDITKPLGDLPEMPEDYYEDDYYGSESAGPQYMDMTEHELSKSVGASNLKNIRIAAAHDTQLMKACGFPTDILAGKIGCVRRVRTNEMMSDSFKEMNR
ncbi:hypothetical protein BGW38_007086 [Lunasporangiospora selenospora]|uniref:Uncharacterized protein n=1 Tax=Lunasporangiospora selenospora TaxID=979761 RepID=A0A9P6KAK5_9FUNG|nr:hypothetical protein BGW38_007086 [Lunasporangiospora selenospora]